MSVKEEKKSEKPPDVVPHVTTRSMASDKPLPKGTTFPMAHVDPFFKNVVHTQEWNEDDTGRGEEFPQDAVLESLKRKD